MLKETIVVNKRKELYDVYIGRGSIYGNSMRIGERIHQKPDPVTREEAVAWYRTYFYARLNSDAFFKGQVLRLKGKRLGCFCKPLACHGDVIVEYLEKHEKGEVE